MPEYTRKILEFMQQDLDIETSGLEPDSPLFSSGVVDSFSLVSLLTFIEEEFDIRVGPADVNLDNFDSLQRMIDYIASKAG
jgi:acyl carrier protein